MKLLWTVKKETSGLQGLGFISAETEIYVIGRGLLLGLSWVQDSLSPCPLSECGLVCFSRVQKEKLPYFQADFSRWLAVSCLLEALTLGPS